MLRQNLDLDPRWQWRRTQAAGAGAPSSSVGSRALQDMVLSLQLIAGTAVQRHAISMQLYKNSVNEAPRPVVPGLVRGLQHLSTLQHLALSGMALASAELQLLCCAVAGVLALQRFAIDTIAAVWAATGAALAAAAPVAVLQLALNLFPPWTAGRCAQRVPDSTLSSAVSAVQAAGRTCYQLCSICATCAT